MKGASAWVSPILYLFVCSCLGGVSWQNSVLHVGIPCQERTLAFVIIVARPFQIPVRLLYPDARKSFRAITHPRRYALDCAIRSRLARPHRPHRPPNRFPPRRPPG